MSNDAAVIDGDVTWEDVHAQLTQIATRRATLDAEEARWLRRAEALQIWKPLGMVNALDYMERTLGYAPHAAHERLRVARSLGGLPTMERAFSDGRLGFTAVRELTRVVTPTTETAWVAAAVGKTLREIEPMVAEHQPGDLPDDPPTPRLRSRKVTFDLPPETYAVLRQAHLVLDEEHGRRLTSAELIDVLARRAIAAAPVSESTGRATYQLAVTVCGRCKAGWQEGGGQLIPVGAAVVERAECDAQWISIADAAHARVKASQDIPPAVVRFIYRRDHGRCRVPGCRSTRCLEIHHIIHRGNGGTHDVWNLILTCSSCHQAHHDGRLVMSGTADQLDVTRPAEPRSHVGPASHLGNAIARAQAKSALVKLGWKPAVARAAIDRVAAELPTDATVEAIVRAAIKVDPASTSHVGPADAVTQARSALVKMGWDTSIARAALDRAATELPADAAIEALVRAALRHCGAPMHTHVRARDGTGPTWNVRQRCATRLESWRSSDVPIDESVTWNGPGRARSRSRGKGGTALHSRHGGSRRAKWCRQSRRYRNVCLRGAVLSSACTESGRWTNPGSQLILVAQHPDLRICVGNAVLDDPAVRRDPRDHRRIPDVGGAVGRTVILADYGMSVVSTTLPTWKPTENAESANSAT